MNLDDMNIPQFELKTPAKDAVNVGFIFITIGLVAGVAAAIANNYVVRKAPT